MNTDNRTALRILYDSLPNVLRIGDDKVLNSSKYVKLARKYGYSNYRFMTYSDLYSTGANEYLSEYNKSFIRRMGAVLVIFNTMSNIPISAVIRSLFNKEFSDISYLPSIYGLDFFDDKFKYGDYIIVTEGIYDADSLRGIYPNTVSAQTSSLSYMQAEILMTLTDRFIIAFDSDDAGTNGYYKSLNRLNKARSVDRLIVYGSDKDVGVLEEMDGVSSVEYNKRYHYYDKSINDIVLDRFSIDLFDI